LKILVDLQCVQVQDGVGAIEQKSLAHCKAIARNLGSHELIIALSDLLPSSIDRIRVELDGLVPQSNIHVWHATGPVFSSDKRNSIRRQQAEIFREAFIAKLNPDIVHIGNLFSGFRDNSVLSIGAFESTCPIAVTVQQAPSPTHLPLEVDDEAAYPDHYWRKLSHLSCADLILTHTEACRTELLDTYHFGENIVINVSTAASLPVSPADLDDSIRVAVLDRLGVSKPFVAITTTPADTDSLVIKLHAYSLLPTKLREEHQLLIANLSIDREFKVLRKAISALGLSAAEVRIVSMPSHRELSCILAACRLFIPSKTHGHLALDAMARGSAALAEKTDLFREIIGREDSLFDPTDELAISQKIAAVLQEGALQEELRDYSLRQSSNFSLDTAAIRTIASFEQVIAESQCKTTNGDMPRARGRPTMAFVSPLPPEKTGIADYSAELLPELAKYYKIDLITPQGGISDAWARANCPIRTTEWFSKNALNYDRIVYQFGNSPFHSHMFDLLREYPGVVVLHDFFLGDAYWHDEAHKTRPNAWSRELLHAHGYLAVKERFHPNKETNAVWKYPCNLSVIQNALSVVVHSQGSRDLARNWYCDRYGTGWHIVPLLRRPPRVPLAPETRAAARSALEVPEDAFLVCSFGSIGHTKINHRIIAAWGQSSLSSRQSCILVFVGSNHGNKYGNDLVESIKSSALPANIRITGWASESLFRLYLQAADLCVQLRALSRGETSAAVLDCMNHGLATIVNSHGTMAELSNTAVWMIPDQFSDEELADALETLYTNAELRHRLGRNARRTIVENHLPRTCASRLFSAIEQTYAATQANPSVLIKALVNIGSDTFNEGDWINIAQLATRNTPSRCPFKRVFIDVTATATHDLKTGIERVARALTMQWLNSDRPDIRFEPVYLSNQNGRWHYRLARKYALKLLDCPTGIADDEPAVFAVGDVLVIADFSGGAMVSAACQGLFADIRRTGATIHTLVYDIMPLQYPELFPPGADESFFRWISTIFSFTDGIVAISRTVAERLSVYSRQNLPPRERNLNIGWFHLGSDIPASRPSMGMNENGISMLNAIRERPTFLMVGTIEPRKGHLQVICAFDILWANSVEVNLVVVGKEGWKDLHDANRRTIPEIVSKLRAHPRMGSRLFWLDQVSDEYLEQVYASSACLLAASMDEGFGLPIVEAMRHGIPAIARDISVFREVAGENATYFSGDTPDDLSKAVQEWLGSRDNDRARPGNVPGIVTWKESAQRLLEIVLDGDWIYRVPPIGHIEANRSISHRSAELVWLGFSDAEQEIRWTDGSKASIGFNWPDDYPRWAELRISLDTIGHQTFNLALNDEFILSGSLTGLKQVLQCTLGPVNSGMNYLSFSLPNARQPNNTDRRLLALAIRQVTFEI
jgi:glycosyltransferase involved in cell wall biosynthesis